MKDKVRIVDRLRLYGMYNIRYVPTASSAKIREVRALFLGESKKNREHVLVEEAGVSQDQAPGPGSVRSLYLDVMFMAYRQGNHIPESPTSAREDSFEVYYCNPDELHQPLGKDIITLPANYTLKRIVCGEEPNARAAFEKLKSIGENTGLIDRSLDKFAKTTESPLTRTQIRQLHRGFTKLVERIEDLPEGEAR